MPDTPQAAQARMAQSMARLKSRTTPHAVITDIRERPLAAAPPSPVPARPRRHMADFMGVADGNAGR